MVASAGLCWRGQTHAFWERVQVSLRQRSGLIGRRSLLNSIDVLGYRSIRVGKGMKRVLGYALADPHKVPKQSPGDGGLARPPGMDAQATAEDGFFALRAQMH